MALSAIESPLWTLLLRLRVHSGTSRLTDEMSHMHLRGGCK
jgi:hypothetical protein